MSSPLRILILDDDPADVELIVRALKHAGIALESHWVSTEKEFVEALEPAIDVILADYSLPSFDALAALEHVKRSGLGIPFIVLTGMLGDEAAVNCIKLGATDYLLKDRLRRLGPAVERAVEGRRLEVERARAEHASQESRLRMEHIIESAMDAFVTVDERQRIMLFNPAAERMFGVAAEEAIGAPIERFIPRRFRAGHAEDIRRFKETGVTNRRMGALGAIYGLRANGEEFPIEASISQGEVGGAMIATVILRDSTERKANEDARNLLAQEIDHRAKNALAVVQAIVSLTRASTTKEFVDSVRGRLSALGRAHSLLALSKWEGGDLAQIVADETTPYQRPGQIEIRGPSVVLATHAVQPLSLLIHELATNAVKYGALSVDQGRVDVQLSILPGQRLGLSWTESGGPAVQEPTSKGFGSTLVNEVVTRQLGGSLDMGWPSTGLRLVVTLPSSVCRLETAPIPVIPDKVKLEPLAHAPGARVLVVEDEALISMVVCAELTDLGWDVVGPAATVEQAIQLIAETPPLDAAVLDVNLAGQMAYPVAERLRALGVPFVFCTGYAQLNEQERYRDSPIVRKPVNIRLLDDELHRLRSAA